MGDLDPHDLRIDIDRLLARIDALGEIGRIDGPDGEWGNARLALTDEDGAGRDLVVGWMRDLGMEVAIDAIGNVVATRPGSDPNLAPVMTGSHIDTVGTGGRFDGNLGCSPASKSSRCWNSTASRRRDRSRWRSSRTRRAPGSPRTCWAAWCTWAGSPSRRPST